MDPDAGFTPPHRLNGWARARTGPDARPGTSTVAISVGEQPETVEDMYEPFLIQQGMIARTPRGRVAMPAAYRHVGLQPPAGDRPHPHHLQPESSS